MRQRRVMCAVGLGVGSLLVGVGIVISAADRHVPSPNRRDAVATVTSVEFETGGRGGPSRSITLTFDDDEGNPRTATLEIGQTATPYREGDAVAVVYDAAEPAEVSLRDEPDDPSPLPWIVPVLLGAGIVAISAAAARRLHWTTRVLRDNPWVVAQSRLVERTVTDERRGYVLRTLELRGAPDERPVFTVPVAWRAQRMNPLAPQAWVAGSDRRFLAAAPGGAPILRLRRIRPRPDFVAPPDGP